MKLNAYLVLAHSQPHHLCRLVNTIADENSDVYIHVDCSVDIEKYKEGIEEDKSIYFIENRRTVTWMGYSTVLATLDLMQAAVERGYKYYNLISGADYPIKSNDYIAAYLENTNLQLINYWRLSDRKSWLHKIEYFHHVDLMPIRGPEHKRIHKKYWSLHNRFKKIVPKRKFLEGVEPYGGAPWWGLTHGCVDYILKYVARNESYCNYFKYTLCPDDMFFQTIVLNSHFADTAINIREYEEWSTTNEVSTMLDTSGMISEDSFNLRYIDWSGEQTGERETPAVLDDTDFNSLRESHCILARKFDESVSESLLDQIDQNLR